MTDVDGQCSFSCTYATKKVNDVLNDLIAFSDYDPNNAMKVIVDISRNVERARQYIIALHQIAQSK